MLAACSLAPWKLPCCYVTQMSGICRLDCPFQPLYIPSPPPPAVRHRYSRQSHVPERDHPRPADLARAKWPLARLWRPAVAPTRSAAGASGVRSAGCYFRPSHGGRLFSSVAESVLARITRSRRNLGLAHGCAKNDTDFPERRYWTHRMLWLWAV